MSPIATSTIHVEAMGWDGSELICAGLVHRAPGVAAGGYQTLAGLLDLLHDANTPGVNLCCLPGGGRLMMGVTFLLDEWSGAIAESLGAMVTRRGEHGWAPATNPTDLSALTPDALALLHSGQRWPGRGPDAYDTPRVDMVIAPAPSPVAGETESQRRWRTKIFAGCAPLASGDALDTASVLTRATAASRAFHVSGSARRASVEPRLRSGGVGTGGGEWRENPSPTDVRENRS